MKCVLCGYIYTYYVSVMSYKPDIELHIVLLHDCSVNKGIGFGQDTTTTSVSAQIHEQYQVEESLININTIIYTISESWIHSP